MKSVVCSTSGFTNTDDDEEEDDDDESESNVVMKHEECKLLLSVYVDDLKMVGLSQNLAPCVGQN